MGARATVLPGIRIGEWAMIGACALVTRDVPAYALVVGAPARQIGWVCRCGSKLALTASQDRTKTWRCPRDGWEHVETP